MASTKKEKILVRCALISFLGAVVILFILAIYLVFFRVYGPDFVFFLLVILVIFLIALCTFGFWASMSRLDPSLLKK